MKTLFYSISKNIFQMHPHIVSNLKTRFSYVHNKMWALVFHKQSTRWGHKSVFAQNKTETKESYYKKNVDRVKIFALVLVSIKGVVNVNMDFSNIHFTYCRLH